MAIEPGYLLVFVATVMVLSFSSPGIPSGGFLVTLPFYVSAGIPVEGVILLRVVDAVPDIFKTLVNVTADMSVAAVAARADSHWLEEGLPSREPASRPAL